MNMQTPQESYRHFDWQEVRPGIWFGTVRKGVFQPGNVTIVTLPEGGSLVVDTQNSDFLGQEILAKAKELGGGPVSYVVNTHLHQDHLGGNIAFRRDNPDVQILAHRYTCEQMPLRTLARFADRLPMIRSGLAQMESDLDALDPQDPAAPGLALRIEGTRRYLADAESFEWEFPDTALDLAVGESHVLKGTARRIEIHFLGRAHTCGDLVIYLPEDRLVIVGDLWESPSGFTFLEAGLDGRDGSVLETPVTLTRLKALDFDTALAGHAEPMHGKQNLERAIRLGEDIIAQVRAELDQGRTIATILQHMPPQDGMPVFFRMVWTSVVVRAAEEIEICRQHGLPLPGENG